MLTKMITNLKVLIIIVLSVFQAQAYLVPNDSDYKINKTDGFQYILPSDQLNFYNIIKHYSDFITPIYEADYNWKLDERTSIVLASKYNQIPNAFAMTSPNNLTVYYSGGVEFLESSASSSWIYLLSTHERAHIYQLNVKQSPAKELKHIFGNDPVLFLPFFPLPIFLSPNQFLPTFIVEGNAVLNESRFKQGGRLFSGESRALALALIYEEKADLKLLMNDHIQFPFGNDKYIVGGYFQNFLAKKYGIKKVNSFFLNGANRYLNPFYLKTSFAETFYQSYETLYTEFLKSMKDEFPFFKKVKGKKLTSSLSEILFNTSLDESKILFTTQVDGKNRRKLNILNKNTQELATQDTLLKGGKVFELAPNRYASVSSDYIHQTQFLYSLFDETQTSLTEYEGKYIHDLKAGHSSYFLMSESVDSGILYKDNKFIAETESKSLLDKFGNIYYFKQNGSQRELFKNSEKLFSFQGYYSLLQDIVDETEIYFTANTSHGAGLYCYCHQAVQKILEADNIARAIKIQDHFLISAIEADGYSVYLSEVSIPTQENPANYDYSHLQWQAPHSSFNIQSPEFGTLNPSLETFQDYFSLREMRFNRFSPSAYYLKKEFIWLNEFSFIDPLFWSSLDIAFSFAEKSSYNYLNYSYNPYLVDFFIDLANETWDVYDFKDDTSYRTDSRYTAGIEYPLYEKSFHKLSSGWFIQDKNIGKLNYTNSKIYFDYTYNESYQLNYLPYRYFSFRPSLYKKEDSLIVNLMAEVGLYLGKDFYVNLGSAYLEEKLDVLSFQMSQKQKFKDKFPLLGFSPTVLVEKWEQNQIILTKEIPFTAYYYRFPVSVRRLAPFIAFQDNKSYDTKATFLKEHLTFMNLGLEAELLFFHRIPARIKIIDSEVTFKNEKSNIFAFQLEQKF